MMVILLKTIGAILSEAVGNSEGTLLVENKIVTNLKNKQSHSLLGLELAHFA